MLYCEEAVINCDNYGEVITFDLAISGEKNETIAEKRRDKEVRGHYEVFCKSLSAQKSTEWKESRESRKSTWRIVVSSRWNLEFEVNQDQYLYGHERQ